MRRNSLCALLVLCFALPAAGQSLEERLREVGNAYAAAYVAPLVDGLGANLNTGLFPAAHFGRRDSGLDLYLGVRAMAMPVSSDDDSFDLTYQGTANITVDLGPRTERLSLPATYIVEDAPAVFGDPDPGFARVHVRQDTSISHLGVLIPVSIDTTFDVETIGGLTDDLSLVPFAVVEAGVGTYFGTSVMVRWLPSIEVEDVGSFGFIGFGLRHNLTQYLPQLPFELAVQGAWQRILVQDDETDVLRVSAYAANVEMSKRFGPLTLFAGLQTEEARIRAEYEAVSDDPDDPAFPIDLDLRSDWRTRLVLGADVGAGPVHLFGDLNLGAGAVFSAGIGFAY
ncbi:MAG TPA: DUF6588 family protein [Rhodothermales bacterium]